MNTALRDNAKQLLNKVPEITIFFWIIKILATTVGETVADFLIFNMKLGLTGTSLLMGALLFVFLIIQVRSPKYVPWKYWGTVVLVSIFGTLVTDSLVDNFGVALTTTTSIFSVALLATFISWYFSEQTLSIHTIYTTKRELFYWAAILFTFALGTAAGDLVAEGMQLGYGISALIYGALIAAITFAFYVFKVDAIWAFWSAYILTRPFGASCGDLLAQPVSNGGLGLGTVSTSAIFLVAILGLVVYLSLTQKKLLTPTN